MADYVMTQKQPYGRMKTIKDLYLEQKERERKALMQKIKELETGEHYDPFVPVDGHGQAIVTPGTIEYLYQANQSDIFVCVASSLEMARMRRDEWLKEKGLCAE